MLKVTNIESWGWEAAIRGMRNPKSIPDGVNNSWDKADSHWTIKDGVSLPTSPNDFIYELGPNDLDLACRLIKAGPEHAKFLRMIHVQMDITGSLYWWKEMDTYKVATVANSCSTMHKIHSKEFEVDDFSCEHLIKYGDEVRCFVWDNEDSYSKDVLEHTICALNYYRERYLETKDKKYWWQLIQLLPSSYNQIRTWDASLATVLSICEQRKGHKLDEWEQFRQECFDNIPYCKEFYESMTGKDE